MSIDLKKIIEHIQKCGFVLEHNVTEKLKSHQWSVINNRYYVDDVQESAREIDLIAYKVNKVEEVFLYTTLVVSCKKSESNVWALLFRDHEKDDPNIDWFPIKLWSNNKILNHMTSHQRWRSSYLDSAKSRGIYNELFEPTGHLFAFQEMDKSKYSVQNDKNIFSAVSSLMKAEAYEMNSLERRKKNVALYNFNLLSVIDSDLVQIHFKGKSISATVVDEARSIFNYIVNRQETASRIHFCTFKALESVLDFYDQLHDMNCAFFKDLSKSFYKDVFSDWNRAQVLKQDFEKRVLWIINLHHKFGSEKKLSGLDFRKLRDGDLLKIEVDANADDVEFLNGHSGVRNNVKRALESIYHYSGDFAFVEDDIPF